MMGFIRVNKDVSFEFTEKTFFSSLAASTLYVTQDY